MQRLHSVVRGLGIRQLQADRRELIPYVQSLESRTVQRISHHPSNIEKSKTREFVFTKMIIRIAFLLFAIGTEAWIPNMPRPVIERQSLMLSSSPPPSIDATSTETSSAAVSEDEDDDEEYEYIEYENLTEQEFVGSEWLVGTNFDRKNGKIDETWARLIVDASGKNVVVWGDNSEGTWALDVASQFLSLSKENKFTGKDIWAATIEDYYFLQGTVRGWRFWSAAAVLGQWQARRLGVDKDEAGLPPWFEDENENDEAAETSTNVEAKQDDNES